ncbi:MAG: hypothetical protein KC491_03845 [Dehalococcoidia bacterium]|nr:hypothetical protein [Dehalococcoidia bacterium]
MSDSANLSESELAVFAQKLDAWAGGLEPREKQFLEQILSDAAFVASSDSSGYADLGGIADDDVQGFDFGAEAGLRSSVFAYGEGLAKGERELDAIAEFAG